ncbi:S8 family serine peptidase, partial [Candidatus Desantisbacteria bacterium]|nr:S8 family serine peptidase [Candidatus Desantisbacteria bacterium]
MKLIEKYGFLLFLIYTFNITSIFGLNKNPANEYVPGELIVKFKGNKVDIIVSEINEEKKSEGKIASISSLSTLNKKYKVKKIVPLFKSLKTSSKIINSEEKAKEIKNKFAKRSHRQLKLDKVPKLEHIYTLSLDKEIDVKNAALEYSKDPNIEYAEPNYIYYAEYIPNDPSYASQWAHPKIKSESGWDITLGDQSVIIAMVDTGADYNHQDLSGNIWMNFDEISGNSTDDDGNGYIDDIRGWDFYNNDNSPLDDNGHGTHTSGIAAAIGNNSVGVTGIAPGCKIMILKAGSSSGSFSIINCVKAIEYAANNGADIISNSWGGSSFSYSVNSAFEYANSLGAISIASAGNENSDGPHYPSGYDKVLCVAATSSNDSRASFSNYGADVDVSAPGVNILSTLTSNRYGNMSGTSMSTPFVSGLAGLILSKYPTLTNENIKFIIKNKVDEFGVDLPVPDKFIGKGRINVLKALQYGTIPSYNALISNKPVSAISANQEISGTANGDSYTVQIGEGYYPIAWETIGSGAQDQNNYLAALNTTLYKDGIYTVRLIVNGSVGEVRDQFYVEINNVYIEEPDSLNLYKFGDIIQIKAIAKHSSQSYILEYALSSSPNSWSSNGLSYSKDGEIISGTWDTQVLPDYGIYILRVRSTFNNKESVDTMNVSIEVYQQGWPQQVSGEYIDKSSPMIADIDNDGHKEVIIGTTIGNIYVWNYDGTMHFGWPQNTNSYGIRSTVAVSNIDNDNELEIIVNATNKIYVYEHDGNIKNGWPVNINLGNTSSPVIYDMGSERKILIGMNNSGMK